MRLINEFRTVSVSRRPGRTVEAVVRRRGIDVRAGGRGFVLQTEEPVTLIVRNEDTLDRVTLPGRPALPGALVFVAAPVAAVAVARMFRPKRST